MKFIFLQLLLELSLCGAFVNISPGPVRKKASQSYRNNDCNNCLNALTERQQQFWEDVEEGLDDIEKYYRKKGESIDRIRRFGMR